MTLYVTITAYDYHCISLKLCNIHIGISTHYRFIYQLLLSYADAICCQPVNRDIISFMQSRYSTSKPSIRTWINYVGHCVRFTTVTEVTAQQTPFFEASPDLCETSLVETIGDEGARVPVVRLQDPQPSTDWWNICSA